MDSGALLATAGMIFTAVLTFFGVKITATKSSKASTESVAVVALTSAMNGWIERSKAVEKDLESVKVDLQKTKEQQADDRRRAQRALVATRKYVTELLSWVEVHVPGHRPPEPPAEYYQDL